MSAACMRSATRGLLGLLLAGTLLSPAEAAQPRFYLTKGTFNGGQALQAGARGFHFASFWEIHDVSALRYDTKLNAFFMG